MQIQKRPKTGNTGNNSNKRTKLDPIVLAIIVFTIIIVFGSIIAAVIMSRPNVSVQAEAHQAAPFTMREGGSIRLMDCREITVTLASVAANAVELRWSENGSPMSVSNTYMVGTEIVISTSCGDLEFGRLMVANDVLNTAQFLTTATVNE